METNAIVHDIRFPQLTVIQTHENSWCPPFSAFWSFQIKLLASLVGGRVYLPCRSQILIKMLDERLCCVDANCLPHGDNRWNTSTHQRRPQSAKRIVSSLHTTVTGNQCDKAKAPLTFEYYGEAVFIHRISFAILFFQQQGCICLA